MDLKWLLVRRITLVALACLIIGCGFALARTTEESERQNAELAEAAARHLDLQLWRISTALDTRNRFPDWEPITSFALKPGQCIELRGNDGVVQRSSCSGIRLRTQ